MRDTLRENWLLNEEGGYYLHLPTGKRVSQPMVEDVPRHPFGWYSLLYAQNLDTFEEILFK